MASTTTASSSIKGSSLLTLHLEVGVKALSSAANAAAGNVVSPVVSQVKNHVQNQVQQFVPSWTTEVESTACGAMSVQNRVHYANQQFLNAMEDSSKPVDANSINLLTRPEIIVDKIDLKHPFPIRVDSKIVPSTVSTIELNGLVVTLAKNPDDLPIGLQGIFFDWAPTVATSKGQEKDKENHEEAEQGKEHKIARKSQGEDWRRNNRWEARVVNCLAQVHNKCRSTSNCQVRCFHS